MPFVVVKWQWQTLRKFFFFFFWPERPTNNTGGTLTRTTKKNSMVIWLFEFIFLRKNFIYLNKFDHTLLSSFFFGRCLMIYFWHFFGTPFFLFIQTTKKKLCLIFFWITCVNNINILANRHRKHFLQIILLKPSSEFFRKEREREVPLLFPSSGTANKRENDFGK